MKLVKRRLCILSALGILLIASCSGKETYKILFLPAPEVYSSGLVNPFTDNNPVENAPFQGILYATDRNPSQDDGGTSRFYTSDPGGVVRLGIGYIERNGKELSWEEARQVSLLKNRTEDYPISVKGVHEIGLLDTTYSPFLDPALVPEKSRTPATVFSNMINEKLAVSTKKDIYVYVHGFKTIFENPLLVTSELWHYLGYDGVFIAYSWPATKSNRAYLADSEKAKLAGRNFRLFLEYLTRETEVETIHILGYSMGTRVVSLALSDIALMHHEKSRKQIRQHARLGNVILCGSDLSLYVFGACLEDGILNVLDSLNIYVSESDKALNLSRWLISQDRLGQITKSRDLPPQSKTYLRENKKIHLVDVTDAADSKAGNGHNYLRKSPWVSSDILMTFMYNLTPEQRGLVHDGDSPVWYFPTDYIARLRDSLGQVNPSFKAMGRIEHLKEEKAEAAPTE